LPELSPGVSVMYYLLLRQRTLTPANCGAQRGNLRLKRLRQVSRPMLI